MIEAPFTLLGEILLPLISGAAELSLLIFVASVRPWYYLLSPSFREATSQKYAGRSVIAKAAYLLWGGVAVLGSIGVVVIVVWFFSSATKPRSPSGTEVAREVARKVQGVIKQRGVASSSP
jgi:hypothetical protein